MKRILVDGNNLIWRTASTTGKYMENGTEFGFIRALCWLKSMHPTALVQVVWDKSCYWRSEIWEGYKLKDVSEQEDPFKDAVFRTLDNLVDILAMVVPQYWS